jgi:hypothetical protein
MTGAWCAACGQKWGPADPTWHDVIHEAGHEFLHVDGKIFRTLRLLLTRPGELTAELLRGRRVRYIGPLRLYLTASVAFFLLSAVIPNVDLQPGTPPAQPIITAPTPAGGAMGRIRAGQQMALTHSDQFAADVVHAFPKMLFALVPVFALALRVMYRRDRRHYPAFLYFSLHFHAALFLVLALTLPLQTFASDLTLSIAEAIALVVMFVYLVVALRRVFGGIVSSTVLRAVVVVFAYACVFGLAVFALIVGTFYMLGAPTQLS